jgi:hypothetical protein
VRSLVKLSTRFLFETLLFAKHKNSMQQWTEHLAILYARDAVSADWFIQMLAGVDCDAPESESSNDTRWLERSMLRCVVAKARTLIGQLATRVARGVTLVDGKVLMRDAVTCCVAPCRICRRQRAHRRAPRRHRQWRRIIEPRGRHWWWWW